MQAAIETESHAEGVLAKLDRIAGLVGNTPLLAIDFEYEGAERRVYAKCEQMNLTGSIKDRMVCRILRAAYASGELKPGDTIAEVSSGNTGISFAAIGGALGHPVTIFMPDWMSEERRRLIRSYGAEIVGVSREQGGFLGSLRMSREYAASRENVFLPLQFDNQANVKAHFEGTGPEIERQLARCGTEADAFVAGVGTGGTVMGVGQYLRSVNAKVRVYPVEPAEAPGLSEPEHEGHHRIQGISDEFVPAIVDLSALDAPIAVSDGDAILMAQAFATQMGLGAGISSGCNFLAAVRAQNELGQNAVVVTVFADDNKKYLSTDLMRTEPSKPGYLSSVITLRRITAIDSQAVRQS